MSNLSKQQETFNKLQLRSWERLGEKADRIRREIASYERSLTQHYQELNFLEKQRRQKPEPIDLEEILQQIRGIPRVERVAARNGSIWIKTANVTLEHWGVIYDIGKFLIQINWGSCSVRVWNRTRLIEDQYHHPHIRTTIICFGEIKHTLPKLLANFLVVETAQVLVRYLYSYNHSEPYCSVRHWPIWEGKHEETAS